MASCSTTTTAERGQPELFLKAVNCLLEDKSFMIGSEHAKLPQLTAKTVLQWMTTHSNRAFNFEDELKVIVQKCFGHRMKKFTRYRAKMWSTYHFIRTSTEYSTFWGKFCKEATGSDDMCPAFYQFIGHEVFKELIKRNHEIPQKVEVNHNSPCFFM